MAADFMSVGLAHGVPDTIVGVSGGWEWIRVTNW